MKKPTHTSTKPPAELPPPATTEEPEVVGTAAPEEFDASVNDPPAMCRVAAYTTDGHLMFHSQPTPRDAAEQLAEKLRGNEGVDSVVVRNA